MSKESTIPEPDSVGTIQPQEITTELRNSYLDYAMSVIVSRALPDVRDGLKPVHRRILMTLHDLHLTATAKHRKCGQNRGGMSLVTTIHMVNRTSPALVRLAQDFSLRYPLVNGQGNFGSVDGDGAAAMRYTEARMTAMAEIMLADIEKETVDFIDNYDATRTEPVVLPARCTPTATKWYAGYRRWHGQQHPPSHLGRSLTPRLLSSRSPTSVWTS